MAESEVFGTTDSIRITVFPAASNIKIDHKEVILYSGTEGSVDLKASVEPADADQRNLKWKLAGSVAKLTDQKDGTVTIEVLSSGKGSITVTETTGKTAIIPVIVKIPVAELKLKMKGTTVPGGTVSVSAEIYPQNASDKTLKWSLNVDENIATINSTGQIRINKDAPNNTELTVCCEATGAPAPVKELIKINIQ